MSKEKILILSVGGSEEPLIFSIREYNPDIIVFIHSPQTVHQCPIILNDSLKNSNGTISKLVENYSNEYNDYKEKHNITDYLRPKQVQTLPHYDLLREFTYNNFTNILESSDNLDEKVYIAEIPDAEELDDSFDISQKVISKFADPEKYEVYVDFTGGTKPMVSGLVLSVIEANYPHFMFCYVGSIDDDSRTDGGTGKVETGKEFLKKRINPYKKRAITEFKRGINFFNEYQYSAAKLNFEEAKNILKEEYEYHKNESNKEEIKKSRNNYDFASICWQLADFYQKWDLFNDEYKKDESIVDEFIKIINLIENNRFLLNLFDSETLDQIKTNKEFLEYKINDESLNFRLIYYLADLLNNADRRRIEGKYDDSVARLYRANELLAQIKLNDLDLYFDEKIPEEFILSIEKIRKMAKVKGKYENINKFIGDNFRASKRKKKNYEKKFGVPYNIYGDLSLARYKSYDLLKLFDVHVNQFKFDSLDKSLDDRNKSILAHGLKPINNDKTNEIYKQTLSFIQDFFPDIQKQMDYGKFPKLNKDMIKYLK